MSVQLHFETILYTHLISSTNLEAYSNKDKKLDCFH